MNTTASTVSKIENGNRRLDEDQAIRVDEEWDLGGLFTLLVFYASLGHSPDWFAEYLDFEERAESEQTFDAQTITGLLQTEEYARALLAGGMATNVDEILEERMSRQRVLDRESPPDLHALISQAALEWPVGSPEIMRAQFARLLELSERPNITIRVVPRTWEVGAHAGLDGPFLLLSGPYGEVAYAATSGSGRLVSAPAEVRSYSRRFDRIAAKALPEAPSRELIRKMMEELA